MAKMKLAPVIRVAPLGEIKVYQVTEAELDEVRLGSSASTFLNLGLFFCGLAISFGISLAVTTIESARTFAVIVIVCVASSFAAAILFILAFRAHSASGSIVKRIKSRMPPPEGVQEIGFVEIDSPTPPRQLD